MLCMCQGGAALHNTFLVFSLTLHSCADYVNAQHSPPVLRSTDSCICLHCCRTAALSVPGYSTPPPVIRLLTLRTIGPTPTPAYRLKPPPGRAAQGVAGSWTSIATTFGLTVSLYQLCMACLRSWSVCCHPSGHITQLNDVCTGEQAHGSCISVQDGRIIILSGMH